MTDEVLYGGDAATAPLIGLTSVGAVRRRMDGDGKEVQRNKDSELIEKGLGDGGAGIAKVAKG